MTTPDDTKTPRTDAVACDVSDIPEQYAQVVRADFARALERELGEAKADSQRLDKLREMLAFSESQKNDCMVMTTQESVRDTLALLAQQAATIAHQKSELIACNSKLDSISKVRSEELTANKTTIAELETRLAAAMQENARAYESYSGMNHSYQQVCDERSRMCARVERGEFSEDCPFCLAKHQAPGVPNPMCHLCKIESDIDTMRLGLATAEKDAQGKPRRDFLRERIKQYLCLGGLFNPEMMEHEKVRNLIMDLADWMDGDKPRANLQSEIDAARTSAATEGKEGEQ